MLKHFGLFVLMVACFGLSRVFAQADSSHKAAQVKPDSLVDPGASANQKDFMDVIHAAFNRKKDDSSAQKPESKYHFSVVPAVGYTYSSGVAGIVAANVGFFTADPQKTNVSNISATAIYSQYNQLTIPLQTNIWTKDNNYNVIIDWRFYKYPQDTYGLGGHSSLDSADLIDYSHLRLRQSVLKKITGTFYAGIGYFLDYHWDVEEQGLPGGSISDAKKYGLPVKTLASGPVINLLFDDRKNAINPLQGTYANVLYRSNLTWMGSNTDWQSLTIDIRKYIRLSSHNENVLAFWSYDWLTLTGNPPYLDLPSTGWDAYNNTGRGYIQGRFRGKNMLYLEAEYRFGITRNGLLGGVVFTNAEAFSNYPKNNIDAVWPAAGLGLRIKVNKHSNTNIAIDYGFGTDGSRGFFVNLGEVF